MRVACVHSRARAYTPTYSTSSFYSQPRGVCTCCYSPWHIAAGAVFARRMNDELAVHLHPAQHRPHQHHSKHRPCHICIDDLKRRRIVTAYCSLLLLLCQAMPVCVFTLFSSRRRRLQRNVANVNLMKTKMKRYLLRLFARVERRGERERGGRGLREHGCA